VITYIKINYIVDHTALLIFWLHWTNILLNALIYLSNIYHVFWQSSTYDLHHKDELKFIPISRHEMLPISQ